VSDLPPNLLFGLSTPPCSTALNRRLRCCSWRMSFCCLDILFDSYISPNDLRTEGPLVMVPFDSLWPYNKQAGQCIGNTNCYISFVFCFNTAQYHNDNASPLITIIGPASMPKKYNTPSERAKYILVQFKGAYLVRYSWTNIIENSWESAPVVRLSASGTRLHITYYRSARHVRKTFSEQL
jgi:hypothetical protein